MAGQRQREEVQRAQKRQGKEGNRWVNTQPSGDDIAAWFKANVQIEEGLDGDHYVGGVTLIPSTEKSKEIVGWDAGNSPIIKPVYDLVFTPYMRVETRVKYFHDLMAEREWLGVIEPIALEQQDPRLPRGFFFAATRTGEGREVRYIGCSMKVTVYERASVEFQRVTIDKRTGEEDLRRTGKVIIDGAPATKMVPVLGYGAEADNFAIMKAETGAVGRALGMAGMLVIPGTGIATAEDMVEAGRMDESAAAGGSPEAAELPDDDSPVAGLGATELDDDDKLREQATRLIDELKEFPESHTEFMRWAKERGHVRLSEVTSPALRGLVRKAENTLEDARKASVADAPSDPLTE